MSDSQGWASPDSSGDKADKPADPPQPAPPPPGQGGWSPHGLGKPGVIPLRPLGLTEILDGSITTIRRHPGIMLGFSAVVVAVTQLLGLGFLFLLLPAVDDVPLPDPQATPEQMLSALGDLYANIAITNGPFLVLTFIATTFLSGVLTVVIGRAVLGRPIKFGEALAEARSRFLPLLGLSVLYLLMVVVGGVLCIIPGIFLYVWFALATPALVLEKGSIMESFRRSTVLVRGAWWRVFGVLLLAWVITNAITFVIGLPFGALAGISTVSDSDSLADLLAVQLLPSLGSVIAGTITLPFTAAVTSLVYIDQRMRREGMDIQLARSAGI
ncbi:hypothetical protein [Amycolatopsis suaedae]|uniref:DUF7847 domain-containing protein n=1 Tax=Amycolatopsis suaedae TaxID=2510978 RepID=A0A4Q7J912_9PSEU|nr:hypothetical protein [Amycolatopsis suaedae]RZQ62614.1 hypothetical protein EWH70_16730 [Amycolatopsis suaedae]